jgi:hypothetical protein
VSASANGVDLVIELVPVDAADSLYDLTVGVWVPGSEPVEVKRPGGSVADVQLKSIASGEVVFESLKSDKEALESQPPGFEPSTSETLSDGNGGSSTYRVILPPGRYELTARTFDPVAVIESTELQIP